MFSKQEKWLKFRQRNCYTERAIDAKISHVPLSSITMCEGKHKGWSLYSWSAKVT